MFIITGATGFIGSALVWELNEHGRDDLVVSDHVPPNDRPGPLSKRRYAEFVKADDLFEWLKTNGEKVTGIFHMGACSSTTEMDEAYLQRNNVDYTRTLFEFCTERNIPFVYASSGACYGDGTKGFDDATDPSAFTPLNPYGWSKLNFDIWATKQKKTPLRWYGLRFFNVYGPNEYHKGEMSSVAFKAFKQIRESGRLKLFKSHNPEYGDGEQLRDFVYVKDIVRWMREMMDDPKVASGIYNMGFGTAKSWLDLARATFASLGKTPDIDWIEIPAHIRNQYQYFTQAKMDRLLGQNLSAPRWPLTEGVRDYVVNYLAKEDPHL